MGADEIRRQDDLPVSTVPKDAATAVRHDRHNAGGGRGGFVDAGKVKNGSSGEYIWMFPKIGMGPQIIYSNKGYPQIIYWIIRFSSINDPFLGYPYPYGNCFTFGITFEPLFPSSTISQDGAERSRALQKRDPSSGRQEGRIKCDQM